MSKTLVSIVIPVYNEEDNVERAYEAVAQVFRALANEYELELIFMDNHSTDRTFTKLQRICMSDQRVRAIRFTRNFGFNKSLLTGYRLAQGDVAIQLDCDLQDSPELFSVFLEKWKLGHDVVVGIRAKRKESRLLEGMRKAFYRFLNRISEDNLVVDGGDFRLVDRKILDQLRQIYDATPYVRGLISTLAANQTGVPYERDERKRGKSKFSFLRLVAFAVDGIVSHSTVPLRLASLSGFVVSTLTVLLALFYFVGKLTMGLEWPAGFATEVVLILLGISLNAIFLGIIGEYISRIYKQILQRPITVIENSMNLLPPPSAGIERPLGYELHTDAARSRI